MTDSTVRNTSQADASRKPSETSATSKIPASKIRKILVCQQRQLGDVLLTTPAIELLGKRFPDAEIHVFTEKKCLPMLMNNPYVHSVHAFDRDKINSFLSELKFYWQTGRNHFDLLVNFQHLPRCTWVSLFSDAKIKLASNSKWYSKFIYSKAVPSPKGYSAAKKAGILQVLGISWNGERPRLYLTEEERAKGHELLGQMKLLGKPFISVDATHRDSLRRWPASYYAELMDMVLEARPELNFMLSYGPGEEDYTRELRAMSKHPEKLVPLPGVQQIRHVAACMEPAIMHLGNCSAPRHMAVALNVPTFGILEPRGPKWTFPSPDNAYVELNDVIPGACQVLTEECMTKLLPEIVYPRFMAHLERHAKPFLPSHLS